MAAMLLLLWGSFVLVQPSATQEPLPVLVRTIPASTIPDSLRPAELLANPLAANQIAAVFRASELRVDVDGPRSFLFDFGTNLVQTATLRRQFTPNGRYTWVGALGDVPGSSILLLADPQLAFGTIQFRDSVISIAQISDTIAILSTRLVANDPAPEEPLPTDTASLADTSAINVETDAMDEPPLKSCPNLFVYLLVLYTPQAVRDFAELPPRGASIGQSSLAAVEIFNQALSSAGVGHRMKVVDTVMIDIPEWGTVIDVHNRLRTNSEVKRLRRRVNADVVALWIGKSGSSCGYQPPLRRPQMSGQDTAFTVVRMRLDCLDHFTFAHELGHAAGLAHDREKAQNRPGAEPWSFGYKDAEGGFSTLMAYPECPSVGGCPRQPILSHPGKKFNQRDTGIDHNRFPATSAMNGVTVAKTMCAVAAFSRR